MNTTTIELATGKNTNAPVRTEPTWRPHGLRREPGTVRDPRPARADTTSPLEPVLAFVALWASRTSLAATS